MARVKLFRLMVPKDKEFGSKISELVGLMIMPVLSVIAMQNLPIAKYFDIYSFRSFISIYTINYSLDDQTYLFRESSNNLIL